MDKKFSKPTVPLAQQKASRIRRDPASVVSPDTLVREAWWNSREWEIRLAIGGIIFFAVAIAALVIDLGEFLIR
jgi:hypothetical protein